MCFQIITTKKQLVTAQEAVLAYNGLKKSKVVMESYSRFDSARLVAIDLSYIYTSKNTFVPYVNTITVDMRMAKKLYYSQFDKKHTKSFGNFRYLHDVNSINKFNNEIIDHDLFKTGLDSHLINSGITFEAGFTGRAHKYLIDHTKIIMDQIAQHRSIFVSYHIQLIPSAQNIFYRQPEIHILPISVLKTFVYQDMKKSGKLHKPSYRDYMQKPFGAASYFTSTN